MVASFSIELIKRLREKCYHMRDKLADVETLRAHRYASYAIACLLEEREVLAPDTWDKYFDTFMILKEGYHEIDEDSTLRQVRDLAVVMQGYRLHRHISETDQCFGFYEPLPPLCDDTMHACRDNVQFRDSDLGNMQGLSWSEH